MTQMIMKMDLITQIIRIQIHMKIQQVRKQRWNNHLMWSVSILMTHQKSQKRKKRYLHQLMYQRQQPRLSQVQHNQLLAMKTNRSNLHPLHQWAVWRPSQDQLSKLLTNPIRFSQKSTPAEPKKDQAPEKQSVAMAGEESTPQVRRLTCHLQCLSHF